MVGQRDLHRGVHRLGSGIDEEDAIQVARRELGHPLRELEALRMRAQERRDEVELGELPVHRFGDFLAAVTGVDAKHTRRGVDELLAAIVPVVHALGPDHHLRVGLEVAVGRERHPVLVERDPARLQLVAEREFGVAHRDLLMRQEPGRPRASAAGQLLCSPNARSRLGPVVGAAVGQGRRFAAGRDCDLKAVLLNDCGHDELAKRRNVDDVHRDLATPAVGGNLFVRSKMRCASTQSEGLSGLALLHTQSSQP